MENSRRRLLAGFGCALGAAVAGPVAWPRRTQFLAQDPEQDASRPNPNSREPQPDPALAEAARKAVLQENQKDIKKNVEKLYQLASELKEQVDKTDSATVLSLALVKKAEEIEKLARQIKDRAKG